MARLSEMLQFLKIPENPATIEDPAVALELPRNELVLLKRAPTNRATLPPYTWITFVSRNRKYKV
jgi:hypothetical protein